MKLTGNLKKQVEATTTKDEARETIRNAGMILDDTELDQVSGGWWFDQSGSANHPDELECMDCGARFFNRTCCPTCGGKRIHVVER